MPSSDFILAPRARICFVNFAEPRANKQGKLKFGANTKNFHSPGNSMINIVLETRKGNPITLCVIFLRYAPPIYRSIIDAGVVGGLSWGLVSLLYTSAQAFRGDVPSVMLDLPR